MDAAGSAGGGSDAWLGSLVPLLGFILVWVFLAYRVLASLRGGGAKSAEPRWVVAPTSTHEGMPALPANVQPYKRTRTFEVGDIPKGLLSRHTTAEHVWGVIHVVDGDLGYRLLDSELHPGESYFELDDESVGIIPPQAPHQVALLADPDGAPAPVRFYVEFWKDVARIQASASGADSGASGQTSSEASSAAAGTGSNAQQPRRRRRQRDDTGVPLRENDFRQL